MSSNSTSLPPILRMPPELRLKIYRHLLRSNETVRMKRLQDDDEYVRHLNCLFPTILSTFQLIYNEAMGVLYGENVFRAHRTDDTNNNTALIICAKFLVGIRGCEHGEGGALNLESFLSHPNLKLLVLEFRFALLENSKLRGILSKALIKSGYSSSLRVRSALQSRIISYNAKRLMEMVDTMTLIRNDFPEDFKKIRDNLKKVLAPCEKNRELKPREPQWNQGKGK
jgi:hypothetical protein